jgi:O-antigen/teichoic acid export membrane protein
MPDILPTSADDPCDSNEIKENRSSSVVSFDKATVDALWKEPGFHRPLAGVLYNIIYIFLAAGFGILFAVWLIPNIIYPFPEAMGMENVVNSLFVLYFTILDLGIGASITRFVAEENIKHPYNAIKYIQFFIWYQMFSGLLQVSAITLWVLFIVPGTDLTYASWLLLVYCTVQYPGMLGIFRGTLEAYQRFDKSALIGFIQTQVFENILRIVFILLGRWWGRNTPMFGEILGAAMGSLIGKYLREFVTAWLAGHWVSPILKSIDPTWSVRTLFRVDFDLTIVKRCLAFGLKVLIPSLVYPLANFVAIAMMLAWLPNYSTILGLYSLGEMLAHMVTTFQFTGIGSTISESYFNKKFKLTQSYVSNFFRWCALSGCFMLGLLFSGSNLIGLIAGQNFAWVAQIIRLFIFFKVVSMFTGIIDNVLTGCGKPEYNIWITTIEQLVRLFVLWLLLIPFPSSWAAIVISIGMGWIAKTIAGLLMIHKRLFPIKLNIWQTFVAPILAALCEALVVMLVISAVFPALSNLIGNIGAAVVLMVLGILIGPLFIFFPLYTWLGGYDDASIRTMRRSIAMAGPSRAMLTLVLNICEKFAKISPLYNRFPTDEMGVEEEIQDLIRIKAEQIAHEAATK